MGSDKARVSYDDKQQYRSVVMQQGRVTVEADWNEAQQILTEETRKEALDFVGPVGTPDNGYEITVPGSATAPFDFQIGPGTMYVGGMRVTLPGGQPATYLRQPDWFRPTAQPAAPRHELVYLELYEQEVSAVEDSALREVALGGPDTAQRTRLIQLIQRFETNANTCGSAWADRVQSWHGAGMDFNPDTMRLVPQSSLRVGFVTPAVPPDPCEPTAAGGYLEAENQLIRVQIASAGSHFLWGYDNASFLYQIETVSNGDRTLKLKSRPVDDFHRPRAGQIVEVLATATKLSNGEHVAGHTGHVTTLSAAYNPDTQSVTLTDAVPAALQAPSVTNESPRLFLRVWESQQNITPGTPVSLRTAEGKEIGVQVTLQVTSGGRARRGDFWTFAVRPRTPQQVYPKRYQEGFQPPEGPRRWACPLAVINWNSQNTANVEDCREKFDNLVELTKRRQGATGCCTVVITPEDVRQRGLQEFLNTLRRRGPVTVCLMPGRYALRRPLLLGRDHSNFTIEGCHDGAVLHAEQGFEKNFLDGLVIVFRARELTLRNLVFDLPVAPFIASGGTVLGLEREQLQQIQEQLGDFAISIGVRTMRTFDLTVEDCFFSFPNALAGKFRRTVQREDRNLDEFNNVNATVNVPPRDRSDVFVGSYGVGILSGNECRRLTVRRNRFLKAAAPATEDPALSERTEPFTLRLGYAHAPSLQTTPGGTPDINTTRTDVAAPSRTQPRLIDSVLDDAAFEGNEFSGMTLAMLIWSETGVLRIRSNNIHDSYAGVWLLSLRWLSARRLDTLQSFLAELGEDVVELAEEAKALNLDAMGGGIASTLGILGVAGLLSDTRLLLATLVTLFFPVPPDLAGAEESVKGIFDLFGREDAEVRDFNVALKDSVQKASAGTSKESLGMNIPAQAEAQKPEMDTINKNVTESSGFIGQTVERANTTLGIAVQHLFGRPSLQLMLDFSHNTVDTVSPNAPSGNALLIWDTDEETNSMVTVSSNLLRNRAYKLPTAAVLMVDRCTFTGNLCLNESILIGERTGDSQFGPRIFLSLILIPNSPDSADGKKDATGTAGAGLFVSLVAITGNVFKGLPLLPLRELPAVGGTTVLPPFNTWNFLNTQSW